MEYDFRCVRFEESNDGGHLIVCAATTIPARDAAPLKVSEDGLKIHTVKPLM